MPAETAPDVRVVRASRIGAIANEIIGDDGETQVLSVFERSLYVHCPRGIVCIGVDTLGAGPINIEIDQAQWGSWVTRGIAAGLEGRNSAARLHLPPRLAIETASAEVWLPPPPPRFAPAPVRRGLETFARFLVTQGAGETTGHTERLPADGLARLVLEPNARPVSAVERSAAGPLASFRLELPKVLAGGVWCPAAVRSAMLLVGLGPGLTPSGDDLLAGVMLAMSAAGHEQLRDALWAFLEPELDALTTPISAMHLSAAADGMALEPLHVLRDEILRGEIRASSVDRVGAIGHTSGWDAAAGMVLGLSAAIEREGNLL